MMRLASEMGGLCGFVFGASIFCILIALIDYVAEKLEKRRVEEMREERKKAMMGEEGDEGGRRRRRRGAKDSDDDDDSDDEAEPEPEMMPISVIQPPRGEVIFRRRINARPIIPPMTTVEIVNEHRL